MENSIGLVIGDRQTNKNYIIYAKNNNYIFLGSVKKLSVNAVRCPINKKTCFSLCFLVFDSAWYLEVLRQKPLSGRYLSVCGQRRRHCGSLS